MVDEEAPSILFHDPKSCFTTSKKGYLQLFDYQAKTPKLSTKILT
jgi:hypothetical protein